MLLGHGYVDLLLTILVKDLRILLTWGGGYPAWVDAGFAGNKPGEELKTSCMFRPSITALP
ncbi:hypothetical protein JHK82_030493 [Glycine max]|nr:hypothetical protein JHK82_030493 [Glycine max]KAG5145172.1 hypothetical protein JHK84_030715 [Glycine max]